MATTMAPLWCFYAAFGGLAMVDAVDVAAAMVVAATVLLLWGCHRAALLPLVALPWWMLLSSFGGC